MLNQFLFKKKPLTINAAYCVHRGFDAIAVNSMIRLGQYVDPKVTLTIRHGDALIDRARQIVASNFLLRMNQDVLLFLDDDIIFDPADAIRMCLEVEKMDLGVCGGAYPIKQPGRTILAVKPLDKTPIKFGKEGEITEVRCVSTGFMAIHRKVLEKVAKDLPLCHPDDLRFYPFFQPYPKDVDGNGKHIYLSEDWAFTERCRDAGFKIYVDGTIRLKHAGRYEYTTDDLFKQDLKQIDNFSYEVDGDKVYVNETVSSLKGEASPTLKGAIHE